MTGVPEKISRHEERDGTVTYLPCTDAWRDYHAAHGAS
jgi:hypothetical protein